MRASFLLLVLVGIASSACKDAPEASATGGPSALPPASKAPGGAPTVTIRMGPDGRTQVDGAPPKGDPKTCAALAACCKSPALGLFCGLTQATGDDCAKQLASVQAHMAETKAAKPAACP